MAAQHSEIIGCQRALFDIPDDLAYFNCASLAPLMRSAQKAGEEAIKRRAEPWRIAAEDWFSDVEKRRSLFAELIGADVDGVALVPATSYGLATAAKNLSADSGEQVLVIAEDYPSNIYTWRAFTRRTGSELVTVARTPGRTWTEAVLSHLNKGTAIVAIPNVHWTDGTLLDLRAIGNAARAIGAKLVIDASQSLGAVPFDVESIRPAFLVAVGYKWLLGPFGLGYLYVAPEYRQWSPLEENWIVRNGAEDFARLVDYTDQYARGSRRFDVGERTAFECTPMANACLRQILSWGVPNIAATLKRMTARIEQEAPTLGMEIPPSIQRGPHMLGLRLPANALKRAREQMKKSNVYVGIRSDSMRISPHLYTNENDVDRLIEALRAIGPYE
jgi:selenocysteine lyase/cysteine desulfurase